MTGVGFMLRQLYSFLLPAPPVCAFCGTPMTDEDEACHVCAAERERLRFGKQKNGAYACYYYDGPIKDLVRRFKYSRQEFLSEDIAKEIAGLMVADGIQADYVTYVPLHRSKKRRRGFDQAQAVADALELETGIPAKSMLVRTRRTKTQANLSPEMRKQNVKNAFKLQIDDKKYADNVIILLDDVYTTGATMQAAHEALAESGVKRIIPITFAVSTYGADV